jgi:Fibronectin type III domain
MTDSTKQQLRSLTKLTGTAWISLRLTLMAGLFLAVMPLLTGCGGGDTGSDPIVAVNPGSAGVSATLEWNPVHDSSVSGYYVHYGKNSPNRLGSCNVYEHSKFVDSPSATLTNLDPNTTYYFAVSAYNGLESACSNEVSTPT